MSLLRTKITPAIHIRAFKAQAGGFLQRSIQANRMRKLIGKLAQ